MKFEIINPSDEAYIEGDFKTCVLATLFFGEGKYALREVGENGQHKDGGLEMPLLFLTDPDVWLKKTFGKPLEELLKEVTHKEIADVLLTVHLAGERSSMNDFTKYANDLGKRILVSEEKKSKHITSI